MFEGLKLTNKGIELLAAILNGDNVQFTKIKMGDGVKPSNFMTLTNLVNTRQTLNIARKEVVNKTTLLLGANLSGTDVGSGFYWREIGIFAKNLDGDNTEYLFSYDNAGDQASYIPAGGIVTEQLIDLQITVGNTDNVTVLIDESLVFATADALDKAIAGLNTSLTTKINTDVASVNSALTAHKNDEENPHKVTKSQVGLGNVLNYSMATKTEATTGASNNKYMSPQRTKEAMEAYGVISDGNLIIKVGGTQPSTQAGKTIIWIDTES